MSAKFNILEIKSYDEAIHYFDSNLFKLKIDVKDLHEALFNRLESLRLKCEEEVEACQTLLTYTASIIVELNNTITKCKEEIARMERQIAEYEQEISNLENEIQALEAEIAELRVELATLIDYPGDEDSPPVDNSAARAAVIALIMQCRERIEVCTERIIYLKGQITILKANIEKLRDHISAVENALKEIQVSQANINHNIDALNQNLTGISKANSEFQNLISVIINGIDDLTSKAARIKIDLQDTLYYAETYLKLINDPFQRQRAYTSESVLNDMANTLDKCINATNTLKKNTSQALSQFQGWNDEVHQGADDYFMSAMHSITKKTMALMSEIELLKKAREAISRYLSTGGSL